MDQLPDIEVRVMTMTDYIRDSNGKPTPMPLLHGSDIDIDIQVSVSRHAKIFAHQEPKNISTSGMDLSPLLMSLVSMGGQGLAKTYEDDSAIRIRASLLPSGYIGAVFSGIFFHNVTEEVRLNFTMTYPGGYEYYDDVFLNDVVLPSPFSRVGAGFTHFDPIWRGNESSFYTFNGNAAQPDLLLGDTVIQDLYSPLNDSIVNVGQDPSLSVLCDTILDPRRRQWCLLDGFIAAPGSPAGAGVVLSSPINVIGRLRCIGPRLSCNNSYHSPCLTFTPPRSGCCRADC